MEKVRWSVTDFVGVITVDAPPVNSLGKEVRRGLVAALAQAAADPRVRAVVLIGNGQTFPAGADISEFPEIKRLISKGESPELALPEVVQRFEDFEKPIVAAIHGSALGGGLELALGCHYRLSLASASVGLPEVQLGIIPGAGGTQRLPRLIDVPSALKMITTGAPVKAPAALKMGILDWVAPNAKSREDLLNASIVFAKEIAAMNPELNDRRVSRKAVLPTPQMLFDQAKKMAAKNARGFHAPIACVEAVEAAAHSSSFAEGLKQEQLIIAKLMLGTQSSAQQYFFFAQREASKVPGIPKTALKYSPASVGVIGAGTMGQGIAMNFIQVGIPVVLIDMKQEFVDNGVQVIRSNYQFSVKRKKLTPQKMDEYMKLLVTSTDYASLKDVDMVIEAVFESMDIKKKVFENCDRICKPSALLCSNTSTLNVDEIAAVTKRPDKFVGTHFFSPANKVRFKLNL